MHTILIIDDNVANLKVASETLYAADFLILTARNGEDGVKRAKLAQPSLILLDVQMPGIDGFETCQRLKQLPETKNIPIIFMTVLDGVSNKVSAFEAGGVDYVTKPIQSEELLARVRTHLQLKDLQQHLRERIDELDAYAHSVAHDLKNPLSRILTGLDILEDFLPADTADQISQIIRISRAGGTEMLRIINELLLLGHIRTESILLHTLDMPLIINDALKRLEDDVSAAQATIQLPENWPAATGHAPWIEAVWVHYLRNALQHGSHSELNRPILIELGTQTDGNQMVQFWVKDNGVGIAPDQQASIFAPHLTPEQARTQRKGLGLTIVRRIITKLGGEVSFSTDQHQGCTFYFTLPAA